VNDTAAEFAAAQHETFAVEFLHQSLQRVAALSKSFKQFRYHVGCIGIRHDYSLAVGAVRVSVPRRRIARVHADACLLGHSLDGLFGQIEAVVARHQDFDAVHELLGRPGFVADDFILFDKMDLNVKFVYGRVVLEISVQAISLLDQNRPAYCLMPFQIQEHLGEVGSTAHLSGFDISELLRNRKALGRSVIAQETKLRWDAETFPLLVLAGHPGIQHNPDGLHRGPAF